MSQQLRFGLSALGVAWAVDLLFWQSAFGINFFAWILLALAVGFILARIEQVKPARLTWLLAAVTTGLASVTFLRSQPFTIFLAILLSTFCLMLTAATFRHAHWTHYRLFDYARAFLRLVAAILLRPLELMFKKAPPTPFEAGQPTTQHLSIWRQILPALRGILLALPILLVFSALLASADPIFGDQLEQWLAWFDLKHLGEYIFRIVYILLFAYTFTGVFLHAVLPSHAEERPTPQKDWMLRILGWTETAIILGAVNLLFAFFVGIQFWYLFGGQSNIGTTQYTYAEYARRGFNELVLVALLSLGMYLALSTITRFQKAAHNTGFTVLTVILFVQVMVVLTSAFQRLLLYENAYGWTEQRTITHVFIISLAVLLLTTIALELLRRRHHFGIAALLFSLGFGITLSALNVDSFIAQRNIHRAQLGAELDARYLSTLSSDAVPTLVQQYQSPNQPRWIADVLGAELACRTAVLNEQNLNDWRSFNASQTAAQALLNQHKATWSQYPVLQTNRTLSVTVNGKSQPCRVDVWLRD